MLKMKNKSKGEIIMIHKYKTISIIYGGSGKKYAETLSERLFRMSEKGRFPINVKIIMENILIGDLL